MAGFLDFRRPLAFGVVSSPVLPGVEFGVVLPMPIGIPCAFPPGIADVADTGGVSIATELSDEVGMLSG